MKAIITGASGTVGRALRAQLERGGHQVIAWDRQTVPLDEYAVMESFVRDERPDVLFHLATASSPTGRENESWFINYHWTSELAWITRTLDVRFVYTSTVMVFTNETQGPFTLATPPDAQSGYGYEKRMAEQRSFYQNPSSVVVRLGWQIGVAPGSNNMIDYFDRHQREQGYVSASTKWLPACSLLSDTAAELERLASAEPGLYMLDANTRWSFYEIAVALNALHGDRWNVIATDDFVHDQRMIDARSQIPPLDTHLPALP